MTAFPFDPNRRRDLLIAEHRQHVQRMTYDAVVGVAIPPGMAFVFVGKRTRQTPAVRSQLTNAPRQNCATGGILKPAMTWPECPSSDGLRHSPPQR
jgi:hypothetical protein